MLLLAALLLHAASLVPTEHLGLELGGTAILAHGPVHEESRHPVAFVMLILGSRAEAASRLGVSVLPSRRDSDLLDDLKCCQAPDDSLNSDSLHGADSGCRDVPFASFLHLI